MASPSATSSRFELRGRPEGARCSFSQPRSGRSTMLGSSYITFWASLAALSRVGFVTQLQLHKKSLPR